MTKYFLGFLQFAVLGALTNRRAVMENIRYKSISNNIFQDVHSFRRVGLLKRRHVLEGLISRNVAYPRESSHKFFARRGTVAVELIMGTPSPISSDE